MAVQLAALKGIMGGAQGAQAGGAQAQGAQAKQGGGDNKSQIQKKSDKIDQQASKTLGLMGGMQGAGKSEKFEGMAAAETESTKSVANDQVASMGDFSKDVAKPQSESAKATEEANQKAMA